MTGVAKISLVLGGARSGKSRYAEALVERSGLDKVYIATGQAGDVEMRMRIDAHKARRGDAWTNVETPLALLDALKAHAREGRMVLVDCLTLWLTNVMLGGLDVEAECEDLLSGIGALAGPVVFVSNEVGLGIVPENALARAFRDHQGRLNQDLAARADAVVFLAAGLPMVLKGAVAP